MHNNGTGPSPSVAFANLYPAILQSFMIILFGYVAARTRLVAPAQARGFGNYITYFALPALLFHKMATIDFNKVDWLFWSSIFLAKFIVFVIVVAMRLITQRSANFGSSALFGIFATQSNDFALGYPIIAAIYGDEYPFLVEYIFFFGPISLVIINPLGFLLMEVQKTRNSSSQRTCFSMLWSVIKGLITNPIVNVVAFGIGANFLFGQKLPSLMDDILEDLGQSFAATALFFLGINMVGKIQKISGLAMIVPGLLICAKLVLLPLVINVTTNLLRPGEDSNMTSVYSTYGFLYGTIPTTTSVFLYSAQYEESQDIIATALVLCTFVAAPVMFITATMVMLPSISPDMYHQLLTQTTFYASCTGLVSCVWVLLIFVLGRRVKWLPHQFTTSLVIAQIIAGIGVILCRYIDATIEINSIIQFIVLLIGVFAARTWTAALAVALCLLRIRSGCFVRRFKFWFYFFSWGYPVVVVSVLLMVTPPKQYHVDIIFDWEKQQLVASICILTVNLVVTIGALIFMHRNDRFTHKEYMAIPENNSPNDCQSTVECSSSEDNAKARSDDEESNAELTFDDTRHPTDIEDAAYSGINYQMCAGAKRQCSADTRRGCHHKLTGEARDDVRSGDCSLMEVEPVQHQLGRHVTLLLCLSFSMLISLSLCAWKLLHDHHSGVYLEMEFLDKALNYGQGCIMLAVFGFDVENVIKPFLRFSYPSVLK